MLATASPPRKWSSWTAQRVGAGAFLAFRTDRALASAGLPLITSFLNGRGGSACCRLGGIQPRRSTDTGSNGGSVLSWRSRRGPCVEASP
jgi:hypothetical protein